MKFLCQILLFMVIVLNINLNLSKTLPATDENNTDISKIFNNWTEQKQPEQLNTDNQYSICKRMKTFYDSGIQLIRNVVKEIRKNLNAMLGLNEELENKKSEISTTIATTTVSSTTSTSTTLKPIDLENIG